ncbi:MAG: hypothetical protein AAF787_20650 [Chloroflexota bacterium]
MGDENKFAVADAVEPEKPKRREIIMPRWVLIAWCVVVLVVAAYMLVSIFRAWAWYNVYTVVGVALVYCLYAGLLAVLTLGFKVANSVTMRILLGIMILATLGLMTFPVINVLLVWTFYCWGIVVLMLLVYSVTIMVASGLSYQGSLAVLGSTIFTANLIVAVMLYGIARYRVHESDWQNTRSYHYIAYNSVFDGSSAMLYECNRFGFNCEELYSSGLRYWSGDDYTWEVDRGTNTRITLFVNSEAIHEAVVE